MDRQRFERNYRVPVSALNWQRHYTGTCEYACVGKFVIYRDAPDGKYEVVLNNSVYGWAEDLGKILRKGAVA